MAGKRGACASIGIFFALASVLLIIFAEIGQVRYGTVYRHIRFVTLDTTGLGAGLQAAGVTDITGLYSTSNVRTADNQGLHRYYQWGFWNYCSDDAGEGARPVYCQSSTAGNKLLPLTTLLSDAPASLTNDITTVLPTGTRLTDEGYLGTTSRVAFYFLLIGAIFSGLSLFTGFLAHRFAFLLGAIFAIVAFICLLVGSAIYTAIVVVLRSAIDNRSVNGIALGLHFGFGNALWLSWAATAASLCAIIPYIFACCFGGRHYETSEKDYY
ncbi:hypothetical protein E5Q_01122 [Mixia osmundae IAM 14324]|uniref:Actin cortical patch SUR7/pH-response regulator PalI n=1 Tax=Mixia osmundae (strain CBS 9802 / IAM 14324 / JCM 22182 / KY 12970) TaxID=764103 RepID=G7DV60_MIXOS|nr:hypothetical protein E5Q_01122 [Mixia osmundae IAM 14324]